MLNKSSNIIEKEFKNLRKELLDLTLRNQLLNFKARAKTITIVNQSPINLYQTLVLQENKMYFVANKKDKKEDKSSVWDHIPFDFSKFSEGDKKLATDLTPKELQKRLYYINNQAKTMLQEQGYNILYLAVGFLEWKDKSKPKQKNNAPLVLIPVSMERKKVGESFNLEWTGEDIQTNISLKAKLLEGGIELPDFEFKKYGEVIDHYIASVRRAVSRMDGWEVNNNVALGFFSFTKFVMYNDLNPEAWADNVDLTKNELIQAIFNPAKNDQESFKEEDIDSQLEYQNMYQVLDADSSQIAAIQDVKAGRNLVVEGPPGTGKSQTIVNLIAELLAEGKSVLFVSEKMAALDVVKDRLTNVGLGKFVLELHSHKTRRKKFLKDLQKATNVRAQEPLNIDQTIRKLETLRRQLDDYSQIIHKPVFAVNLSAFELYGLKESADDHFARKDALMPLVRFNNPETITLKDLDDMKVSLENLAELYQTISRENPWSKCSPKSLLPADLREIEMLINDNLHALDNFLVERGRVYDIYGIKQPDTLNEFENSLSAFEIIKSQNAELIDGSILKSGAWDNNNDDAFRLIKELENYQKHAGTLDKFNQSIFQADIDGLIYELRNLSNKKFRFFNNHQHIDLVERYYSRPVNGSIDNIVHDLQEAKKVIKIKNQLDANNQLGQKYYGGYWHLNANPNDLLAIANWMHEFTALVREGTFSQNTIDLMSKDLFDIKPERDLAEYIDAGEEFVRVLSRLKDKLNPRSKLIFKRETGDVPFEAWREQLYNWRGQLSSLHLWSQYLNTKNALKDSNAAMFVDSIEKRNIKKEDVEALVEGNFADSLLNILFVENHELATFIGELHENRIREFKDLDKKILTLNRKRIYQKLNSNIPKIFGGTENPQAKILAGEFTRKSGHMPVRKLLEKAGGMIKQIKPCFMMSPLSIAQYLDPTNEELQFDVVIFDEASQVKPEDALGAFMRGKTAVVMGDTQQLPPTSFFDQMSDADSDEEEATSLDMESILHLCKLSFPVKMLKWHYRSRHESLISVSNKEFYDNDLLVYPSPSHSDPELGLKFHYNPNTAYARGSGSANPLEAKDVVDEIFNHFDKYGDTKSLGVGTFSVAQKNAILEELEVRRKERPELEPLFSDNRDERFFVKNLETIQGDERDVILISVGYGYDENRKMSLNFGPLNQDGGERRLNVLITRAREKCVVFSNFKAYDMQLTANPPYGVKSLKEFLEYAENLTLGTHEPDVGGKEPFEDAIASFLEENGYTVDRQIGCAGFRVDLAIVDDENPGKYILGITTDGKMYSSSKVARDRDRLREQVLNGLGWKLYHLWSTDWYRNRDLGRKKLLEFIEKSIKETREEEKRRSEEEKKLAEKRRLEAEKKAEELRIAREKEEAEIKAQEEANQEDIGPSDFVEVEKVDEGDFIDESFAQEAPSPSSFVELEENDFTGETSAREAPSPSSFVELEENDFNEMENEDIFEKPIDVSSINPKEFFDDEDFANENYNKTTSEKPEVTVNEEFDDNKSAFEYVITDDDVQYESDNQFNDNNDLNSQTNESVKEDSFEGYDEINANNHIDNVNSENIVDDSDNVAIDDTIVDNVDDSVNVSVDDGIDVNSGNIVDDSVNVSVDDGIDVNSGNIVDDSVNVSVDDGHESIEDIIVDDVDDSVNVSVDDGHESIEDIIVDDIGDSVNVSVDDGIDVNSGNIVDDSVNVSVDDEVESIEDTIVDNVDDSVNVSVDDEVESIEDTIVDNVDDSVNVSVDDEAESIEDIIVDDSVNVNPHDDIVDVNSENNVDESEPVEDKNNSEDESEENGNIFEDLKDNLNNSGDSTNDSNPIRSKIRSFFQSGDDEQMDANPLFSSLKFGTDLGENSDLEKEFDEKTVSNKSNKQKNTSKKSTNKSADSVKENVSFKQDESVNNVKTEHVNESDESIDNVKIKSDDNKNNASKKSGKSTGKPNMDEVIDEVFAAGNVVNEEPEIDIGSDDDYIYVDHSHDDERILEEDDEPIIFTNSSDDSVDLGSDDDYIYVDHSHDDERVLEEDDEEPAIFDNVNETENINESVNDIPVRNKSKRSNFVSSIISDVLNGESQLEHGEIETVRGEIIDDGEVFHKPAPKDEFVVEAEIINSDDDLNVLNDDLPDFNNDNLERPSQKFEFENDDLNVLNDDLPDLNIRDEATRIVDNAVSEFLDEVFDRGIDDKFENEENSAESISEDYIKSDDNLDNNFESETVNVDSGNEFVSETVNVGSGNEFVSETVDDNETAVSNNNTIDKKIDKNTGSPMQDGVTYYQGATDVRNPLRKNNVYYNEHKNKSVKESIKGFKNDIKYINKSLKEIENPTDINMVSVVDRTEEFDPDEYLNRPSDDDSHLILEKEEELTFAEKEEKRIEQELRKEALEKELASDENVIVTVNEQERREELKDKALENIIQTANDDYKEIERERYQRNNKLKTFDDKKILNSNIEEDIVDYVTADDFGLNSADELYKQSSVKVADSINAIVNVEGPVHIKEVTNRIKDSCGIKRAGSNLKKTVNQAIDEAEKSGSIIKIGDFLYDATDNNVVIRRRNKPNIDLISDEEISKNIELVLMHNSDVSAKQIAKETSRNFGFKSTSKKTATRINSVLDLMIANNKVKINNDIVELI